MWPNRKLETPFYQSLPKYDLLMKQVQILKGAMLFAVQNSGGFVAGRLGLALIADSRVGKWDASV